MENILINAAKIWPVLVCILIVGIVGIIFAVVNAKDGDGNKEAMWRCAAAVGMLVLATSLLLIFGKVEGA